MSPETAGVVGIVFLILLFLLGVPVAFAMAMVGCAGFAYLNGTPSALVLLAQDSLDTLMSYPLSVIPMFILMGAMAYASGISQRLFSTSYKWVGHRRGGLTIATVLACAGFAAICGSTAATAATMGKIALPEMKKYRYDDRLATGTVASAGTLGILIPPSTVLIVYGILTEESIGQLFLAGIVPGILLSLLFVCTVYVLCRRNPDLGPPGERSSWPERWRALAGVIEAALLFALTIGGLLLGWFSPTQAGAVGASGALLVGIARRQLSFSGMIDAVRDGLRTSCMVLFIFIGGTVFGHFLAISNIPFELADTLANLPVPPMAIMVGIVLVYFIGGFFMDGMAMIVATVPIFFPVVIRLGFDPIWFGIIIVLIGEMGVITPPVGVNVFIIKAVAPEIGMHEIFRGIFPFLYALILLTGLILVFPQIAIWLPHLVG